MDKRLKVFWFSFFANNFLYCWLRSWTNDTPPARALVVVRSNKSARKGKKRRSPMKRTVSFFVLFVVAATLIAACGGKPAASPSNIAGTSTAYAVALQTSTPTVEPTKAPTATLTPVASATGVSTATQVAAVQTVATAEPTKAPAATATSAPTATAQPTAAKGKVFTLPAGINVQIPLTGDEYAYDPKNFAGWDMICEGTQSKTGDTHLIKVNPAKESWQRLSCWAYPPTDKKTRDQLGYQFAGDKVRNWQSAGVDPLPIEVLFEDGQVLNLAPGEIPDEYNLQLAGVDSSTPFKLNVQGIKQADGTFVASVGAVDEWTWFHYVDQKGNKVTETFFGTRENVSYKEVLEAWRLPGNWTKAQAKAWKP